MAGPKGVLYLEIPLYLHCNARPFSYGRNIHGYRKYGGLAETKKPRFQST